MFAELGAMAATTDEAVVSAFGRYGMAMGMAAQFSSDCHDLWRRRPSHDLLNGRRTLPIAFGLMALDGRPREELEALLRRARVDAECHNAVAGRLANLGALEFAALKVEVLVERGIAALRSTGLPPDRWERLARDLRSRSLLSGGRSAHLPGVA